MVFIILLSTLIVFIVIKDNACTRLNRNTMFNINLGDRFPKTEGGSLKVCLICFSFGQARNDA